MTSRFFPSQRAVLLSSVVALVAGVAMAAEKRDPPRAQAAHGAASASASASAGPQGGAASAAAAKLDLNQADAKDIAALPGLNAAKARLIFENRPYKRLKELVDLSLVTDKELDQFKDRVRLSAPR